MTPRVAVLLGALLAIPRILLGQPKPAVPLEPIAAILDVFRTHAIVALAEGRHNNEQGHAFRLALIRDPRFAATVNDIVVECGSSRYQDVMDRFVRGESVPDLVLRRVWQDTTQPHAVWDVPIYEEFFRAVRAINASLPRERQVRVLLGDPPFDWERAPTREAWMRVDRDQFPADLIQRAVLSKQRRALVVYGEGHFMRKPPWGSNLVTRLGASMQPRIFTIWTHTRGGDLRTLQADVAAWRVPSLALTKDTSLGAASFAFFIPGPDDPRMEDEFDAVLYVGPPSTVTLARLAPSLCADAEYMKMRLGRMAVAEPPGAAYPPGVLSPADGLKQYCASVTAK
jgi:hypothetical protein